MSEPYSIIIPMPIGLGPLKEVLPIPGARSRRNGTFICRYLVMAYSAIARRATILGGIYVLEGDSPDRVLPVWKAFCTIAAGTWIGSHPLMEAPFPPELGYRGGIWPEDSMQGGVPVVSDTTLTVQGVCQERQSARCYRQGSRMGPVVTMRTVCAGDLVSFAYTPDNLPSMSIRHHNGIVGRYGGLEGEDDGDDASHDAALINAVIAVEESQGGMRNGGVRVGRCAVRVRR